MTSLEKLEILRRLENHYISPVTQFSVEIEFLKRRLQGRPQRIHISQPNSWRSLRLQKKFSNDSSEHILIRLEILQSYLENAVTSPFAQDEGLQLGKSIPYFEGLLNTQLIGTHHLFGNKAFLYFYQGNEEILRTVLTTVRDAELLDYFYVIGSYTESLIRELREANILFIENITKHAFLNMSRNRTLANFFNPQIDLILMDERGTYVRHFSRQDFLKQIENIKVDYFPTITADKSLVQQ